MNKITDLTDAPFDGMDPLGEEKKPVIAALLGLCFGALGIAIYFRSFRDFIICVVVFIALTIIIPGFGAVPGWLFAPVYGYFRAESSNKKLQR